MARGRGEEPPAVRGLYRQRRHFTDVWSVKSHLVPRASTPHVIGNEPDEAGAVMALDQVPSLAGPVRLAAEEDVNLTVKTGTVVVSAKTSSREFRASW